MFWRSRHAQRCASATAQLEPSSAFFPSLLRRFQRRAGLVVPMGAQLCATWPSAWIGRCRMCELHWFTPREQTRATRQLALSGLPVTLMCLISSRSSKQTFAPKLLLELPARAF